jgi:hypothetical protein
MTAPDHRPAEARSRSVGYEARTDKPLLILAGCFIAVYAAQVAAPDWPAGPRSPRGGLLGDLGDIRR